MSLLLSTAKTIAIVGNGPVSVAASGKIDDADLVVRMNHAGLCGVAGKRTDCLAVNGRIWSHDLSRDGRPINPLALRQAKEIWLSFSPPTEDERDGRRLVFAGGDRVDRLAEELQRFAADGAEVVPSVGARILRYVLDESDAKVTLFGFSHQGDRLHNWSAEAAWMGELAKAGLVEYSVSGPPHVRQTFAIRMWMQAQRVRNHIRAGRF